MVEMLMALWLPVVAGVMYSFKGFFSDPATSNFKDLSMQKLLKNIVLGAVLGIIAFYCFPDVNFASLEVASSFPAFVLAQVFVDKLLCWINKKYF